MIFWASQLTYEEKFVKKYNIKSMKALGLKGIFSVIILTSMLIGFYFLKVPFDMGQPNGVMEDAVDGFIQLGNNPKLLVSYICKYFIYIDILELSLLQIAITFRYHNHFGDQCLMWY